MHNPAANLYGRTAKTGFTTRGLEAELLTQCAGDLTRAASILPDDQPLVLALERNRSVWNRFALHLRHGDTDLNDEQRLTVLRLASLIFLKTAETCERPDRRRAEALASINLTVAAGLRGIAPGAK
ncbi:flagellar biosynthesis regulator FlaF [Nostoc sp. NIES-2111]